MSIFTAKAAEKEHKDNKKNNFSPFLGSIGWKQEWATKRSEIVRVDELSKLTNGVVFVFGCFCIAIQHILAIFGQIFASFTPAIGSMTTFLLEIMEPRYAFFVKHKNMVKN